MKKHIKLLLVGVAASQLMSCASLELIALGGASYLLTGKGLGDHALSMTMDEDCAFHRVLFEEPLCSPEMMHDEPDALLAQQNHVAEGAILSSKEENLLPAAASAVSAQESVSVAQQDAQVGSETTLLPSGVHSIDRLVDADLPSVQQSEAQIYAVVGSFNDLKYAFERSNLYRIYNTQIVQAPEDTGVRYRVVVGPLAEKGLVAQIPQKSSIDKNPHWAVKLCDDSLLPPPCGGQLLVKK